MADEAKKTGEQNDAVANAASSHAVSARVASLNPSDVSLEDADAKALAEFRETRRVPSGYTFNGLRLVKNPKV